MNEAAEQNWPVVGGEYEHVNGGVLLSRVIAIEANQVTQLHVSKATGNTYNQYTISDTIFRRHHLPADQSPIPDLVAALEGLMSEVGLRIPYFADMSAYKKAEAALAKAGAR